MRKASHKRKPVPNLVLDIFGCTNTNSYLSFIRTVAAPGTEVTHGRCQTFICLHPSSYGRRKCSCNPAWPVAGVGNFIIIGGETLLMCCRCSCCHHDVGTRQLRCAVLAREDEWARGWPINLPKTTELEPKGEGRKQRDRVCERRGMRSISECWCKFFCFVFAMRK